MGLDWHHAGVIFLFSHLDSTVRAILSGQPTGGAYFNYAEEFVGSSHLLGAHKSALWAQGFAEYLY